MVRCPLGNHHDGPDTLLVTSDAAQQTGSVTEETEPLRKMIKSARFVLFDFDGPICRLFAGHSAELIALELVKWLEGHGLKGLLSEQEQRALDPHIPMHAVDRRHPNSDLVAELEEFLTGQELKAVPSARPTPYADPLIRTWTAVGARLAITTNNSARAASSYLETRGLGQCFAPHIYGRTQELQRMKPDPYYLHQALNAMGATPSLSLMLGDTPSDFEAAQKAGVPFVGYARNERKLNALLDADVKPEHIVSSLEPLLEHLRAAA
ncbi:HAD family hydrolase [Streptomyces sp. NPDC060027]|uniref:HAD family hydrolase n=1 Tax=Streptomyces sp. NPDC060027 TaxID=3347040 RepID=UPI0036CA3E62